MKKKNKFKRVKEHGYVIIVDGHTTFPEDICRMLDRLDFLEKERLKRSDNSGYTKCLDDLWENYPGRESWDKDDITELIKKHFA
jgi:hypothetical protein